MSGVRPAAVGAVARLLTRTGLLPLLAAATSYLRTPAFPVLTYHRVNEDEDPFFPAVPTDVFARHMAFLARTFCVMPIETLVEQARARRLPRNAVAITFDDGYRDTLTHAAPILARLGLPATVFLATGLIGTGRVAWVDRLALAFRDTACSTAVAPWGERWPLVTRADRLGALAQAVAHLKQQPDDVAHQNVEILLHRLGSTAANGLKRLMLSWDDVHALTRLGFSIGGHTVNHPILSRVPLERARHEIEGCRDMIQAGCGRRPVAFAYPNGGAADYTPAVAELVEKAGFRCAVTTRFGVNTHDTPAFELRRGGPWDTDAPTFVLRLAGQRLLWPRRAEMTPS